MQLWKCHRRSSRAPCAPRVVSISAAVLAGVAAWVIRAGAASAQTPDLATAPVVGAAALPRDLSPWGMFVSADVVVKAVIVGLFVASVVTWTIWLAKTIELFRAKRAVRAGLSAIASAGSLAEVEFSPAGGPAGQLRAAAFAEIRASADTFEKD